MYLGTTRLGWLRVCAVLLLAASLLWEASALGQQSAPAPPQAQPRRQFVQSALPPNLQGAQYLGNLKRQFNKVVFQTTAPTQQDKDIITEYIFDYQIRRFTHLDILSQLPRMREDLLKDIRSFRSPVARRFAHELVLEKMQLLLKAGMIHPASHVNALLAIGELNESELNRIRQELPKPWPEALEVLVSVVEDEEEKYSDGLKVAAMVGILRHVQFGSRSVPSLQNRITAAMLDLVNSDAPQNRTPEGHVWMQRRAIDVLAELKSPGNNNEIFIAIYTRFADRNAPASLRCTAAESLGRLTYSSAVTVNSTELVLSFLDFATVVCQSEAARLSAQIQAAKEKQIALQEKLLGGQQPREADDEWFVPDYELDRAKRRVTYQLTCVRSGLEGQGGNSGINALAGNDQPLLQQIVEKVNAILQSLDKKMEVDALAREIRVGEQNLKRLRGGAAPAAAKTPATAAPTDADPDAQPTPPAKKPFVDPLDFP